MNGKTLFGAAVISGVGLMAVLGSLALAEPSQEAKPADQPQMQLPPGWTAEDMQACMVAGAPGKMHEWMAEGAGTWEGVCTMWMAPDTEPTKGDCKCVIAPILGGRYIQNEMSGDMPGMGPFNGLGFSGFDNVSQKFVSNWMDSQSTGIMQGTGELSADKKTLSWKFSYNCPIAKKLVTMREIDKTIGPDTKTLEMYGPEPKTGKEFKMMVIELKRTKRADEKKS